MDRESPERKPTRLKEFDYNTAGAYFITICTQHRKNILSTIAGVDVPGDPNCIQLLPYGIIAEKYINQLNEFYNNITIGEYVIMPNHIHILLHILPDGTPRTSSPTRQTSQISHFVSTFKRFCNKEIGENVFQRSFYDRVIRNRDEYDEIYKYIYENPIRWKYDKLYTEE